MQETTTVLYDFWQFMFFAVIFTAICVYVTYRTAYESGWADGYSMLFEKMVNEGIIEIIDEPDEDLY